MDNLTAEKCRLCCEKIGKYFIFASNGTQRNKKIMYCFANINILEGDGLPTRLCYVCDTELSRFYTFTLKCEEANKKLQQKLCKEEKVHVAENVKQENECDSSSEVKCDYVSDSYIHESNDKPPQQLKHAIPLSDKAEQSKIVKKYNRKVRKGSNVYICSACGRQCPNPSTLKIHMRSHTDEKPFSCNNCDKKYKDSGSLTRHEERNHYGKRERNFICDYCGKGFYTKRDVKIHMRIHTGETPYACDICFKEFSQLSTKLRHQKRHKGEKSETCFTCNKKFCTKQELINHYQVHTTEKKYSCSFCKVPFKYKNNLQKHIRQHIEPEKFVCNYCGHIFTVKGNLKIHITRLHSSKSGHCKICSKDVSNIELHNLVHSGECPFKCELCPKSYTNKNSLAYHMNFRHKYPDKYKCQMNGCILSFPSRPMLKFHTAKSHSTEIPFPCDRCSRGFYRKNDLARHKLGTHKEKLC